MRQLFFCMLGLMLLNCSSTRNNPTVVSSQNSKVFSSTFIIAGVATDKSYGYSSKNAVKVGGADQRRGPSNERRYLESLAGPNGERISYYRSGSCCPVKSKNGFDGYAMLDNYRVTYEGSKDTVSIYMNMYDYGEMKAPVGFTIKK